MTGLVDLAVCRYANLLRAERALEYASRQLSKACAGLVTDEEFAEYVARTRELDEREAMRGKQAT